MSEVVTRVPAYTHYVAMLAAVIVPAVLLFCVVSVVIKVQLMRLGISAGSSSALADVATFSTLSLLCLVYFWREAWRHALLTWGMMLRPVFVGMVFNFYLGLAIVSRLVTDQVLHLQTSMAIATAFGLCALISSILGWTLLHLRPHGYAAVV